MTYAKKLSKIDALNFILVGVGGQGTILASNVLAALGLRLGYDVKKAEVHGMSQRGGSVTSHLRWGRQVFSPIVPAGEADYLLAFEKLEAARFSASVRRDGTVLVNDHAIEPMTVFSGGPPYPDDRQVTAMLKAKTDNILQVNGQGIAEELGDQRTANMVMLGALSALMPIGPADWLAVIQSAVPAKSVEVNHKAFMAGRNSVLKEQPAPVKPQA